MAFPNSAEDTGKYVQGCRVFTDETIPNCNRCFVMAGAHGRTKERGWFVFCKRSEDLERVRPRARNLAKAYTYMLDKVHHPDNLYLTCKSCNSSLGDTFLDRSFRDNIVKFGTIGDWLRKNEPEIRKN